MSEKTQKMVEAINSPEYLDTLNIFGVVDRIPDLARKCTNQLIKHLLRNDYYLKSGNLAFDFEGIIDSEDEDARKIYEMASMIHNEFVTGWKIEETISEISNIKPQDKKHEKVIDSVVTLLEGIIYNIDCYEVAKAILRDYQKKHSKKQNKKAA